MPEPYPGLPPLIHRWEGDLPRREVRPSRGRSDAMFAGQPWFDTGPHGEPLDFTLGIRRLLRDIKSRRPEWAHLQPERILVGFTQANSARVHGLQARVTPLRFPRGALQRRQRGVLFQIQRYFLDETEFLYLLTFCLPRFLDQDFDAKLVTVFHELYHISPEFDGDLRRHEGRYHLHTHSKGDYDLHMADYARAYMADNPDPRLTSFLRLNFQQLRDRHGKVMGVVVPRPKLIPLMAPPSEAAARYSE